MSYTYEAERARLFSETGQVILLKVRDNLQRLLAAAGAFQLGKAIEGCTGDSWQTIAAVDRLVELGEIREVTQPNEVAGQHRVFVRR